MFTACENFLNGAEIKQQIEDEIYIANHESPVATVEEPAFSDQGVSKNRAIIISFSMPMDPGTFANSLSITDSQGNSLMQHFITPQWSNDNKLVTVPAKELNLIDLQGQRAMDIYVSLSKSCTTPDRLPIKEEISHKYRVCDNVDNVAPELIEVRGEFTPKHVWRDIDGNPTLVDGEPIILASGQTKELIAGEFDFGDKDSIKQNHISNKADFYIEGNDYGGGAVYAHFKSTRIYDASGNRIFETEYDSYERVPYIGANGNSTGTVSLDLSDSKFMDGLYKVTVTTSDSSMLDSYDSCVYYLIRDTSLANSANSLIWFETPQFRNDITPGFDPAYESSLPEPVDSSNPQPGERWYNGPKEFAEFDLQVPTIESIEYFMYRIQFAYLSNDVYYSENEEESSDFSYYISWGTDLRNMTLPVKIENDDTDLNDPLKYGNHTWLQTDEDHIMKIYNIPAEYKAYQNQHRDKDIYVQTTIFDAVGNSNVLTTLVPGQIEFYNYTVSEGSAADKKKIKLSYYDLAGLGTGLSNITKIPDKDNAVLYRIYYGKIEDGMDESAIRAMELKRNTVKPFERDTGSAVPDSKEFEVEAGSKYIFYI
ncbi:MAG: hypothetical protein IKR40_08810 [Treponema sp.]|nr:hypothetical protein [Treponema sp.]